MPEIEFAEQPRKWKKSLVSMLQMKLKTIGPGFEQTQAKLRHLVVFCKRLGMNALNIKNFIEHNAFHIF